MSLSNLKLAPDVLALIAERFKAIAESFIGYRVWPQGEAAFGFASANASVPACQPTAIDGGELSSNALRAMSCW